MLKRKLEELERRLGGQEPLVIVFVDVPGPELTPEIERRLVDEARRKNPGEAVVFVSWPPELEAKTKGKKQARKKRGSATALPQQPVIGSNHHATADE
jgi:hypothetical protein